MLFGVRMVGDLGRADKLLEYGVLAEKSGFDFIWVSHDLFKINSLVVLSGIATVTKKVKLGNTILNPYSIDPSELATYVATLDELSGKRAVVGISAGHPRFLEWIGIHADKPLTKTKESIEIIRKLLAGERVAYKGTQFNWNDQSYMRFDPVRKNVPFYIGGSGDKFLEYAGESGEGVLPILFPPDYIDHTMECITRGASKAGRRIEDIDIAACLWFSVSKEANLAEDALRGLIAYYGPGFQEFRLKTIGLTKADMAPIAEAMKKDGLESAKKLVSDKMFRLAVSGNPDECISQIEKLEKKGVTQVALGAPIGPDPAEAIRTVGEKIIPYFNDKKRNR